MTRIAPALLCSAAFAASGHHGWSHVRLAAPGRTWRIAAQGKTIELR
jgi:hypothetical protein